jgi:4-hydroxythreonine-4-phosphate dehydrogenase
MLGALADERVTNICRPAIVGSARVIAEYLAALPTADASIRGDALSVAGRSHPIIDIPSEAELSLGTVDPLAGRLAGDAIIHATRMAIDGDADAVVTMPISKKAITEGGHHFPGHTELIASMTGGTPLMILMTEGMRVGLLTIHIPLARVPGSITRELVIDRVRQLERSLRVDFGAAAPRMAMLGLNPHAGEEGLLGSEEIETIIPALDELRSDRIGIEGPFPADGFFARFVPGEYDGILACYHDQGLIPLKFFARGGGVNFTANLPIVRTSPDHGTAFAIAGRGIADPRSTIEATVAAVRITLARRNRSEGSA